MLAPDLLAQSDPEVWDAIRRENQRQEDHVELIASENYVSRAVLKSSFYRRTIHVQPLHDAGPVGP